MSSSRSTSQPPTSPSQKPGESNLEATLHGLAPGLLRYCRARTGERHLAEEIAQEALLVLVDRWRRGAVPESPEAFVFAIARRRAGRALRKRRLLAPFESLLGAQAHSREPDPETRAVERQRLRQVQRIVSGLPRRDREALLLAGIAGLDSSTAARILGISNSAFKMRLHRARQRLSEASTASLAPPSTPSSSSSPSSSPATPPLEMSEPGDVR